MRNLQPFFIIFYSCFVDTKGIIHCMRALSSFPLILFHARVINNCAHTPSPFLVIPPFPSSKLLILLISSPALRPSILFYLPSPPHAASLHMDEGSAARQALAGVLTHPSRAVLLLLHKLFRNKEGGNSQTRSILCMCFSFFLSLLGFALSTLSSPRVCVTVDIYCGSRV